MTLLRLTLDDQTTDVSIHTAIVAGWTGRDRCAVEEHMAELEVLGVSRPSKAPVFYRVSPSRLTTDELIDSTVASSGEAEPVLLRHAGRLWVGVGSDHTDREVESYGVAVAKELCAKPVATKWWDYEEVADRWDQLILRSWITEDSGETLYQEGALGNILPPAELLKLAEPQLTDGTVMFCGTLPARGGIRPATAFRFALEDRSRDRALCGQYKMRPLPMVS